MDDQTIVLYVEDDGSSRRLVERLLEHSGYKVYIAEDGLSGVTAAKKLLPHLVLMDINLPNLDGRVVTTRIKSIPHLSKVPIVALTANNSQENRDLALAAGCDGFLTKPIDVDLFPEQVASFLNGRRQRLTQHEQGRRLEQYNAQIVQKLEEKVIELEDANHHLAQLERVKSDFLTLVSHELRTPLTLISGYANLMEKTLQESGDTPALNASIYAAKQLNNGMLQMQTVIDEIIRVARITTGMLDLAFGPVRLPQIIQEIEESFNNVCQERNLTLSIENMRHLPLIEADGEQIRHVIENVIGNAIKYTPDGGKIHVSAEHVGNEVDVIVRDSGIGIPPEAHDQIFEQFYVLESVIHHSTSKSNFQGGGLGLGLTIAKGIVEAHNGRIWVESERQDFDGLPGSTFHILLPIYTSTPNALA